MTFEEVAERFDVVTGGTHLSARCPAHDDRHASLSLTEGDDGRTLLHCHSGCLAAEIVAEVGLQLGDLFPEPATPQRAHARPSPSNGHVRVPGLQSRRRDTSITIEPPSALPVEDDLEQWRARLPEIEPFIHRTRAWTLPTLLSLGVGFDGRRLTIPVRDHDGALVNVLRYRPGGKPKTLSELGRPRDLFPRPESFRPGPLWLVEGEPDAITLHELGQAATSLPGVAYRPDPERFRGRTVFVCFDCDAPGRQAARAICGDLRAAGVQASIVDLDPGRGDGTDLTDMVLAARAGTAAAVAVSGWLNRLIERTA